MKEHDVRQVEQRVKRYWYTDGIAELVSGGLFILLGCYFGIQAFFGEKALVSIILQVSLVVFLVAGAFGVRWLVNVLKTRLTYPRTGYVEYRVNDRGLRRRRWVVAGAALATVAVSALLSETFEWLNSMVLITGLLVGVIFIALRGRSSGLGRFYALGGLAIVLGLGLAYAGVPQILSLAAFYGLLGFAVVLSGSLVLREYLRKNPFPGETGNE